ncbi:MAG TPA: hypothetical protein VGG39_31640 [Polyangiaceae bacterium]|jgi:hypothetical protein
MKRPPSLALLSLTVAAPVLAVAARAHAKPTPEHAPVHGGTGAAHGAGGSGHGGASPGHAAAPPFHVPMHLAPPLPMLPSLARVRVESARDRVVVTEEVTLPRGEWTRGGLDLYASFGAPGTPIAVDAHLAPIPTGQTEARADDAGESVAVEPAIRHLPSSQLLLGRANMAGFVVRIKDAQLQRAFAQGDAVALRIRSLLAPPAADATGGRDVVVRLGAANGQPLTLEKVQLVALEPKGDVTRVEAKLCGPDAEAWPLTVGVLPRAATQPGPRTIAPSTATRRPSDDLCLRWWSTP